MDKKMNEIIREQRKKTKSYSRAIGWKVKCII